MTTFLNCDLRDKLYAINFSRNNLLHNYQNNGKKTCRDLLLVIVLRVEKRGSIIQMQDFLLKKKNNKNYKSQFVIDLINELLI